MLRFCEWLLLEERSLVDPAVLDSYERAFQQRLEQLIVQTRNPALRRAFEEMRDCPVKNLNGRCSRFVDYIMAALVRQGCHRQYDLEGCLQRIIYKMLGTKGERGGPHKGVFDFDESLPVNLKLGNPLQVRFKKFVSNEIRAINMGCIPSLRTIQRPGRLSIRQDADQPGAISPEDIGGREQSREPEIMADLAALLRRQSTPDLDLVALLHSMLDRDSARIQTQKFGNRAAVGRRLVIQTIEQYAKATQNWQMLRLLDRFRERFPSRFTSPIVPRPKAVAPAVL